MARSIARSKSKGIKVRAWTALVTIRISIKGKSAYWDKAARSGCGAFLKRFSLFRRKAPERTSDNRQ